MLKQREPTQLSAPPAGQPPSPKHTRSHAPSLWWRHQVWRRGCGRVHPRRRDAHLRDRGERGTAQPGRPAVLAGWGGAGWSRSEAAIASGALPAAWPARFLKGAFVPPTPRRSGRRSGTMEVWCVPVVGPGFRWVCGSWWWRSGWQSLQRNRICKSNGTQPPSGPWVSRPPRARVAGAGVFVVPAYNLLLSWPTGSLLAATRVCATVRQDTPCV